MNFIYKKKNRYQWILSYLHISDITLILLSVLLLSISDNNNRKDLGRYGLYWPELKNAIWNSSYLYLHQFGTECIIPTETQKCYLKFLIFLSTPESCREGVIPIWNQECYLKFLVLLSTAEPYRGWVIPIELENAIWNSWYC